MPGIAGKERCAPKTAGLESVRLAGIVSVRSIKVARQWCCVSIALADGRTRVFRAVITNDTEHLRGGSMGTHYASPCYFSHTFHHPLSKGYPWIGGLLIYLYIIEKDVGVAKIGFLCKMTPLCQYACDIQAVIRRIAAHITPLKNRVSQKIKRRGNFICGIE